MQTSLVFRKGILPLLITIIFVVYMAVTRDGYSWDAGDTGMYLMHARNMVTGRAYGDTNYVFIPEVWIEGTPTFPPGLPVLLAPLYAAGGVNYTVFRSFTTALLALSLWPVYFYSRRFLPMPLSIVLVILVGLNPLNLSLVEFISSEQPYVLGSFLFLCLVGSIREQGKDVTAPHLWGIAAGALAAYCGMTRAIGISLMLGLAAAELWRNRRPTRFLLAAGLTYVALIGASNLVLHGNASYGSQFTSDPKVWVQNLVDYFTRASYLWLGLPGKIPRTLLWLVTSALMGLGLGIHMKRHGATTAEFYAVIYMGVLTVYWTSNVRYLIPLVPLLMLYLMEGLEAIRERWPVWGGPFRIALIAVMVLSEGANLWTFDHSPVAYGQTSPEFQEAVRFLREQTPLQAAVMSSSPRVLALFTDRRNSRPADLPPEQLWAFFKQYKTEYLLVAKTHNFDRARLVPLVERYARETQRLFENSGFAVYRLELTPR